MKTRYELSVTRILINLSEWCITDKTDKLFEKENIVSLVRNIIDVVLIKGGNHHRKNCLKIVLDFYNPYYQV